MKLKYSLLLLGLLFIPSFSSAINVVNDLGDYEDIGGNNNCTINSNYSFDCSESNKVIIGTDASWYKTSSSYFRTSTGLATYFYQQDGTSVQGYVSQLLYCGENSNPLQSCNSKRNITYEEFLTYTSSNQLKSRMWYSSASTPGYAGPVFIYDNSYILIAPSAGTNFFGLIIPYNFGLVGYGLEANWGSVGVINPPFNYGSSSLVVNPRYTAQNIYDSYRSMGYSDVLCYGGFALDDVFGTGNASLNGIVIGSGAGIFDLYNSYPYSFYTGQSLDFVSRYNDWDFEYGFFEQYHDQSEFQYYYGRSRGFVGLFMVKNYYFKKDNFDPAVLKSFCEFVIANDPLIDRSKSPLDIIANSVNEAEINQLIGNIGVIVPGTGSALSLLIQNLVGSGDITEDDYYSLLDKGYNAITNIEVSHTEYPGILPTYIIVAFLGFMILYVFKH